MAFPKTYRAISQMVEDVALNTKTARAIVRKGGLRQGTSEDTPVTTDRPRTMVESFIMTGIQSDVLAMGRRFNWLYTDTFNTKSSPFLTLYYSLSSSDALNPGDYAPSPGRS